MKKSLLSSIKIFGLLLTLAGTQLCAVAKEPTVDERFRNGGGRTSEDELPLLNPAQSKVVRGNSNGDAISGPAYLGVTFSDDERSAIVRSVASGSPAELAGVKPGDVIESLQGITIDSPQDVLDLIKKMRPGTMLDIGVSRRANLHAQAPLGVLPGSNLRSVGYPPDSSDNGYNATSNTAREVMPLPPKAKQPQSYRNPNAPRQSAPSSNQRRSSNQNNNNDRGLLNRDRRR